MSKNKSPQKKKQLSLERDRRNTYGENSKSSRKNIARGKQQAHQKERHAVHDALTTLGQSPTEEDAVAAEGLAKEVARVKHVRGFKKTPDEPLQKVLETKRARVAEHEMPDKSSHTRIMYIEYKGEGLTGPARIGRVTFSKSGKTLYYRGKAFQRFKGFKANYFDVESGEHYWISGPKRNGGDALYATNIPVEIDDDVREEYWTKIRRTKR